MPVLHGITTGIEGGLHSKDYRIVSEEDAYIIPIKIMTCTVIDLLADGAQCAKDIKNKFVPEVTKEEYLQILKEIEHEYNYGEL